MSFSAEQKALLRYICETYAELHKLTDAFAVSRLYDETYRYLLLKSLTNQLVLAYPAVMEISATFNELKSDQAVLSRYASQ